MSYRTRRYGGPYEMQWAPYVSVAQRRAKAIRLAKDMAKKGKPLKPIVIEGRKIASTFWGGAWCTHLECFADYANRLPRGRTYVRNGSVVDLKITSGLVHAKVSGSSLYDIKITIEPLPPSRWKPLVASSSGKIGSLVELLQGRFDRSVMQSLIERDHGIFPLPGQMKFHCSCPDSASMCKHVAATLYGVGARLDSDPSLLFTLRNVDQNDLIAAAGAAPLLLQPATSAHPSLAAADLSSIFNIDLETSPPAAIAAPSAHPAPPKRSKNPRASRPPDSPSPRRFPPGSKITTADLKTSGIPRTTFQNWLHDGTLLRTPTRGVYLTTPKTAARIARATHRPPSP